MISKLLIVSILVNALEARRWLANSATALIYPQGITLYQTGDSQSAPGLFNTWLDAIDGSYCTYTYANETGNDPTIDPPSTNQCGVYTPANVISVSYGEEESDLPAYYQIRQCNEFMKLGLQGVTIVFASGDSGAGPGCIGQNNNAFNPEYPACPYITTVGATSLPVGGSPGDPELSWFPTVPMWESSGGFSNIFPIPSYQEEAVSSSVHIVASS